MKTALTLLLAALLVVMAAHLTSLGATLERVVRHADGEDG